MTNCVGIFVFDNVEVLDFAGPYEVFTTASRVYGKYNLLSSVAPFEVSPLEKQKRLFEHVQDSRSILTLILRHTQKLMFYSSLVALSLKRSKMLRISIG